MELWLCGQYRSGETPNVVWDFAGIFSSKELALSACRDRNYFVAPVVLDETLPDETVVMPNVEYPLA